MPSACTAAVSRFLSELNQQLSVSVVSVDCLQGLRGSEKILTGEVDSDGLGEGREENCERSPLAILSGGGLG